MKHILKSALLLASFVNFARAQQTLPLQSAAPGEAYSYRVNLREIKDDRLTVNLDVRAFNSDEATFNFPRIVPGIYGAMDFGRNIVNFKAMAGSDTLPVERISINTWKIVNARRLDAIQYEVNDGWEEFGNGTTQGFYKSAESSFSEGKVFVINNNCLFGYFSGGEKWPVHVTVEKPEQFFAATSLSNDSKRTDKDEFHAKNYRELVDNPILYARPDTVQLQIGNTAVTVACYANSGQPLARGIARKIGPLLESQRQYLGGALPVDRYTFIFYHTLHDRPNDYTGDGLEHATSTLCLLNSQLDSSILNNFVYGIASHEFFHVITPLNIHSEEIQDYDFLAPKMSRHIWLYEGMTEYAMMHMPVKEGLQSLPEFLAVIRQKIRQMQQFDNNIPLTELSRVAMERQDQYYNFYLKGALASLCLDIRLRELSDGKYGTQDMMRDLSGRYGKDKPFKDDELFDVITAMTFPDIRTFFRDYIEGNAPLPLQVYLAKAGIEFDEKSLRIKPMTDPTPAQLQLRKWWINQ
ncbi:MAG TPA: peptidase M61 [Saprospiraceae bacterium]|nr:peptidase M61 [Saprospiraceae bacterium]